MSTLDKILARYGYLNEADDDNGGEDTGGDAGTADTGNTDAGANDNATGNDDDANADNNTDDNGDDDIDINTDLDDNDDTSDDGSGDDNGEDDTGNVDTGDTGGGMSDTGDEEPVPQNKELFDTLTAEEQAIKIKELKMLYFSMYQSLGDIAKRLDNLDTDDDEVITVSRISAFVYDLRTSMYQYITVEFDQKSYMENDFMYNRFLVLIHAVTNIINELVKIEKRKKAEEEKSKK